MCFCFDDVMWMCFSAGFSDVFFFHFGRVFRAAAGARLFVLSGFVGVFGFFCYFGFYFFDDVFAIVLISW